MALLTNRRVRPRTRRLVTGLAVLAARSDRRVWGLRVGDHR